MPECQHFLEPFFTELCISTSTVSSCQNWQWQRQTLLARRHVLHFVFSRFQDAFLMPNMRLGSSADKHRNQVLPISRERIPLTPLLAVVADVNSYSVF